MVIIYDLDERLRIWDDFMWHNQTADIYTHMKMVDIRKTLIGKINTRDWYASIPVFK